MDPLIDVRARPAYRSLVIICSAVGITILFICGIAFMLIPNEPVPSDAPPLILAIFLLIGAASVSASITVRRRAVVSALRPDADTKGMPVGAASPPDPPDLDHVLGHLRMGIIIACAFAEVPAVLGLAYLILGGSVVWVPVFFGGALVAWALAFPRPSEWETWLSHVSAGRRASDPGPPDPGPTDGIERVD